MTTTLHPVILLSLLLSTTLLTQCSSPTPPPPEPTTTQTVPALPDAYWRGDGVPGKPRIVIDLSDQRLRYYKGDTLVGLSPLSSGTPNHRTPTGNFRITEKDLNHRSSAYGDYVNSAGAVVKGDVDSRRDAKPPGTRFLGASMRYFMRFNHGIGMHEGYLPGYPASHGCVRLPTQMAAIFYGVTPVGTPVQVIGNASNAGYQPHIPTGWGRLAHADEPMPSGGIESIPRIISTHPQSSSTESSKKKKKEQIRRAQEPNRPNHLKPGQTWYLE
jgi:hypothetical protein